MYLVRAILIAFLIHCPQASAAEINVVDGGQTWKIITVSGELVDGDDKKFKNIAIAIDEAIVLLEGPGGQTVAGMEIGRTIAIKQYITGVPEKTVCASACGLIWLAGNKRFMTPTSMIGFHASYSTEGGRTDVSSVGNALVGSYLQQLRLADKVIVYATETGPTSMRWLTPQDAKSIGLEVTLLEDEPVKPSAGTSQTPVNEAETDATLDERGSEVARLEPEAETFIPGEEVEEPAQSDWTIVQNSDLPGSDLPGMPLPASSAMQCQQHCQSNASCVAFTFNNDYKACFLKDSAVVSYQFTGAISGYRWGSPIPRLGYDFGPLIKFQTNKGMEILATPLQASDGVTLAWCQDQCIGTQSCKAFNYYDNGRCEFVDGKTPVKKNAKAHFGVRLD
ncbi:PAN domain-containing protein [Pararhizobium sp.]|uniref:PAN domain-containing protein n=1 Tax=Pararhizobium sp. TaxID=1977563 RepID=UPI002727DE2A|nr:PAN domain-containing protein [Pararhizobium sp.]MDO9416208.1 PAN domain-containing protein [Pararhizobium sp.]